ncbi:MAG TPA: hypothetical protein VLJ62_08550, partial [Burkholderiaceae bacterium]|nr:hypothetical protein [Burkholderiaceae bacterium]
MSVTKTIGAGGGVIDGLNGVVLTVPPGALSADVPITIAVDASGAPAFPASAPQIGPAVSITPHGTSFGVPVTISVPFDTTQLPAGEQPLLVKTNPRGDGWQQLAVVREGDRLTAAVTSFSWIGVRCCIDTVHIIDQPDDQTAFEGGFAFFRVEALRYEEVRYQWFRNGLAMRGETNQELLIARVNLAHDNSLYMARVTNVLGGFEDSRAARLLVNPIAPVIVNQPLDAQVIAGDPATFNAASTSSVVQTLQWERCGSACDIAIPNETSTSLLVAAQEGDDGMRFRMCATNAGGKTCSRAALLTVIPRPVQPAIVQQPQSLTVPAEMSASFSVQATGGSLSYRWEHAPRGGTFVAHPNCGDAATCTLSNTSLGDDGTAFRVLVSNNAGSVLSDDALLTVRLNPGAALVRLQGGNRHSIALRADATLLAWGANGDGQLGDGTFDVRDDAVDIPGLTDVATFALGDDHA